MKHLKFLLLIGVYLLLVKPMSARVMILNGLSHENQVNPGESYRRVIEIYNGSEKEELVRLYQKDYIFNHLGESQYLDPGMISRSNAGWIELQQTLITLQPNEKYLLPFEVSVPAEDGLEGTYWSMIMVEKIVPPDPNRPSGVSIRSVVRYGIQVITHIGAGGERNLRFIGTEIYKADTSTFFYVYLENTGDRMLKHTVALDVYDAQGVSKGMFTAAVTRTFPGTSTTSVIDISNLAPGIYTALLVADCEDDDIFGTTISLIIGGHTVDETLPDLRNEEIESSADEPIIINEPANPEQLWGVQVASNPTDPTYLKFPGLENIIICQCGGIYRVLAGVSASRQELLPVLEQVRSSGYPDAWLLQIDTNTCQCR